MGWLYQRVEMRASFLFITFLISALLLRRAFAGKKVYVVYLGGHSHGRDATMEDLGRATGYHNEMLASFMESKEKAQEAIIYSYAKHINGFAAYLEEEVANRIKRHPEVISVFESGLKQLQTTRSWGFLGLESNGDVPSSSLWTKADYGKDVIIAHLDTGVWPESASFRDDGMGPVPDKWRGSCQNNTKAGVLCNRKLIGAKYFVKGYNSQFANETAPANGTARDTEGHGTHTLSTLGGRFVPGASLLGLYNGTSKGGSPEARVATYKVCWNNGCTDADILAGFDEAIHDGVDVLSVSVGGFPSQYCSDSIAIGAFHAVVRGINVACSAGNSGPLGGLVVNTAPWVTTVAASTVDRDFSSSVALGNKMQLPGKSKCFVSLPQGKLYPLINAWEAAAGNVSFNESRLCYMDSLSPLRAEGKIVICRRGTIPRVEKGEAVLKAGGVGMILVNDEGSDMVADSHVIPATMISYNDGFALDSYMNSTRSPVGTISPVRTEIGAKPAPTMAAFSSRGPNIIAPQILKPDITAPGVEILASNSEAMLFAISTDRNATLPFITMSGTSMSCPHVAGVMGLLRKLYPSWSPAAIRSAIMTTASTRDNTGRPIKDADKGEATPFAFGSGHIQPDLAVEPGLVYDMDVGDYVTFLCSYGYNVTQMAPFLGEPYRCPEKKVAVEELNNPSFAIPSLRGKMKVNRKLKNVGDPGVYKVSVRSPQGVKVKVEPTELRFNKLEEEKSFRVTFESSKEMIGKGYSFGELVWSDGTRHVSSPMAVMAAS